MISEPALDVTGLLLAWSDGDASAFDRLSPIVYRELRRIARHHMANERPGHTLQATALVNEAYLRLVDCKRMRFRDSAHFFAVSARFMRRILIEHARRRNIKRGAAFQRISLDEVANVGDVCAANLIAINDALNALEQIDARKSKVVELRFFGGLTVDETAEALGISRITVVREWNLARAWLFRETTSVSVMG